MVVEAGVLSVVAGTVGLGLAAAGVSVLRALAPSGFPRLVQVTVDGKRFSGCGGL